MTDRLKLKVRVMKDDIENGRRKSTGLCPIARAIRRETEGKFRISVGNYIRLGRIGRTGYRADTPAEAEQFISNFDGKGPDSVKPFVFRVVLRKTRIVDDC